MPKKNIKSRTIVIIPCYNEQDTIKDLVLKSKKFATKVLVVDDGSIDKTAYHAKQAGAIVLTHPYNMGKGMAIQSGFTYAVNHKFEYIVTMDGDGQHNPFEIPRLLNNVMNNGHDISIGIRYGAGTEMPKWRKFGKRVLDYATSFGNGGFVTDSQCGFRAFNRKAIEALAPRLNEKNFAIESEQLIRAHETGLQIINTEVSCKYKGLDTSTRNAGVHGITVLLFLLRSILKKHPLLHMTLPGIALISLGLFFGVQMVTSFALTNLFSVAFFMLVLGFLFLGALGVSTGISYLFFKPDKQ